MFGIGPLELCIVGGIFIMLFGVKQLPDLARSLGSVLPEFKKGMKDGLAEIKDIKDQVAEVKTLGKGALQEATGIVNSEIREAESAVRSTVSTKG